MTIWCYNCGQRYTTKLPLPGKRVKCAKCGATFDVSADDSRSDAPPGATHEDAATAADPLRSFFVTGHGFREILVLRQSG
jgi:predicted Zn finger-like uncharacterized protein